MNTTSYYYETGKENLTTWGIFLSSLLLSLGGFCALTMEALRKSRCTKLECCGTSCVRPPLPPDEPSEAP